MEKEYVIRIEPIVVYAESRKEAMELALEDIKEYAYISHVECDEE